VGSGDQKEQWTMWKNVAIVAGSAALGEYLSRKFGAQIEAKAVEMKVPAAAAHVVVVGGAAATGFLILSAIF
jgi:hypothetical protein